MAEIKIEKKKSILPWVLGFLILAAVLFFFFVLNKDENEEMVDTNDVETITERDATAASVRDVEENGYAVSGENDAFQSYQAYIADEEKMGLDHEYSNGALLYLINATNAVAIENGVDISADIDKARKNAEHITEDPMKLTHADKIRNSGEIIADAIRTIQQEKFSQLEKQTKLLHEKVKEIKPEVATLNQKEAVKSFFEEAANVLNKMKSS